MKRKDLVFVGIKGSVVALKRANGQRGWATQLKGSDFVNVVLQEEAILAFSCGKLFCLDPLTGKARWHKSLKGFGMGLATIATGNATVLAAKRHADEQAATVTTAACV